MEQNTTTTIAGSAGSCTSSTAYGPTCVTEIEPFRCPKCGGRRMEFSTYTVMLSNPDAFSYHVWCAECGHMDDVAGHHEVKSKSRHGTIIRYFLNWASGKSETKSVLIRN